MSVLAGKYILVVDDALDVDFCQELIKKYLETRDHKRVNMASDFGIVSFHEQNISENKHWAKENNIVFDYMKHYKDLYAKMFKIPDYAWPKEFGFEQSRLKQYSTNGYDRFDPHVDVGNYNSARRFLVMFWYLNDVLVGGETEFYFNDVHIKVKPKAGRLICFPPTWTHPHAGLKPISNEKMILGTYLHYV